MPLRIEAKLYLMQRLTAVIMAPLVAIHIITILYATKGDVTATEILERTQGTSLWFFFYALFVLAVSIHAPLGVRKILREWSPLTPIAINVFTLILALILLIIGMRAVLAVTGFFL